MHEAALQTERQTKDAMRQQLEAERLTHGLKVQEYQQELTRASKALQEVQVELQRAKDDAKHARFEADRKDALASQAEARGQQSVAEQSRLADEIQQLERKLERGELTRQQEKFISAQQVQLLEETRSASRGTANCRKGRNGSVGSGRIK